MKFFSVNMLMALVAAMTLVLIGCDNSNPSSQAERMKNDTLLAGSWRQKTLNDKDVSIYEARLIITGEKLTMAAGGCKITGEYSTAGDIITFEIVTVEGENCDKSQKAGQRESARYIVNGSELTLIHQSDHGNVETVFERIEG